MIKTLKLDVILGFYKFNINYYIGNNYLTFFIKSIDFSCVFIYNECNVNEDFNKL